MDLSTMEPQSAKLQQVCRICLLHYKGTMTDIHHKPEKSRRIRDVLLTCLPLQVCLTYIFHNTI